MEDELTKPARGKRKATGVEPLAVVGVGVGQQSFRSLQQLFCSFGNGLAAAYVIAVRQQEGLTVREVLEALAVHDNLAVKIASDGEKLEPNHVYVGGPEDLITLRNGHLGVRRATEPTGHQGTIDTMLVSLAEQVQDRAVAVVLKGLGTDGATGVAATKKYGGLSIAEPSDHPEDTAGQGAVGPAGIVDLCLEVDDIARQIALYVHGLSLVGELTEEVPEDLAPQIKQVATILRNVTGNDFHGYKRNTFYRRVQRRMQVTQSQSLEAYIARLKTDREEVSHLFQDLLIGVTQFFRDPTEFGVLERELPRLFEGKGPDDQVRVWVLGCATGEEAYSIAMLLREHMAGLESPPHVQIFATDLDARALALARTGRYPHTITDHVRPDRLARWFVKEGDTYCVAKELREMCIFSPHNLVKDAPFSRIDLLSCRNLLIYLNTELQNRVIPIFHFALRPGGILFLGSSENVTRHQKLFAPIDRKNRVFRRLDTPTRILPDFPLSPRLHRRPEPADAVPATPRPGALSATISRRAETMAEQYAPAYVIVDEQYDVLHFSGRTGRYLEPTAGAANLNLLNLVHRDLKLDLRSALHHALAEQSRVELRRIPFSRDGLSFAVNLIVERIGATDASALMVLFQDAGPAEPTGPAPGPRLVSDEHVQRLEAELRLTKERLEATIEELESTNEELKSSNEEYQSINEELQSANEELETSKEELQSVNEELQTVNGELAHRVTELARTNSDLKNLLESTQIATIFLDNEMRVRNFTPAATDIFHLLDTDIGRPIDHVASRITYPELQADVRQVLKSLGSVERQLQGPDDRHFVTQVLPYRSLDNYIGGTVLTFMDVTKAVRAQAQLVESEEKYRTLVNFIPAAVYACNPDGTLAYFNSRAVELWGREPDLHDRAWVLSGSLRTYLPDGTLLQPDESPMARVLATGEPVVDKELKIERPDGSVVDILVNITTLRDHRGEVTGAINIFQEITERNRALQLQATLLAELQHRVRNILGMVRSFIRQSHYSEDTIENFVAHLIGRIEAMGRTQVFLTRTAGAKVDLESLIRDELLAHAEGDEILEITGPLVELSAKAAEVLTLALHELATNSIKYGALSDHQGRISISWACSMIGEQPWVQLNWEETSKRPIPKPDHAGFGTELIEQRVPYELSGEASMTISSKGLRAEISFPLVGASSVFEPRPASENLR